MPRPVTSTTKGQGVAIAALIAATLFWAGNYVVGEIAVASIDPLSLSFLRWVIAAPVLLVVAAVLERPDWRAVLRALPRLAILGSLGMIGFVLPLYIALQTTTAVSASIIGAICPVLIAVTAAMMLRERLSPRIVIGLALGLAGVVLVVSKGSIEAVLALDFNVGDLWVLLALVCWTAYTVYGRRFSEIPPVTSVGVQAAAVSVILLPFTLIGGLHVPSGSGEWGSVLFIALFPSIGSYLLWNVALRRMPAGSVGIWLNLIPVFVVLIAVVLGGVFTPGDIIGGVLVLAGVLLGTIAAGAQRTSTTSAPP